MTDPGYPHPSTPSITQVMKGNRRVDTKPEKSLRSALHQRGHRFRKDHSVPLSEGKSAKPDIVFTRKRLAIFVDGCYWHVCPEHGRIPLRNTEYWTKKLTRNQDRDKQQTELLEEGGWQVLRIWEHMDLPEAVAAVEALLDDVKESCQDV